MSKEYRVEKGNLVIEIPLRKGRYNPYMETDDNEDGYVGEMDNLIGIYEREYDNGLARRIDMSYKGKDDQYSDYVYKLDGSKGEFEEMCEELKIDAIHL